MNMLEIHLFELTGKGERFDEIYAEEILNRRAAAQARRQAQRLYVRRLVHQLSEWLTQCISTRVAQSKARAN